MAGQADDDGPGGVLTRSLDLSCFDTPMLNRFRLARLIPSNQDAAPNGTQGVSHRPFGLMVFPVDGEGFGARVHRDSDQTGPQSEARCLLPGHLGRKGLG
jgi:hypothetical protein